VKEARLRVVGFAIIIEDQLEHRCMEILRRMRREGDYGFPESPTRAVLKNMFRLRQSSELSRGIPF
jgi:hypothetical protein